MGSSPRVRGKRCFCVDENISPGLIPACAGKTRVSWVAPRLRRAHPRVCGENCLLSRSPGAAWGSSPRVRGKLWNFRTAPLLTGLIPACAGKTAAELPAAELRPAHPRVCGENLLRLLTSLVRIGSSPRVRGKQILSAMSRLLLRLIPACAGKTGSIGDGKTGASAHPRVCGENFVVLVLG